MGPATGGAPRVIAVLLDERGLDALHGLAAASVPIVVLGVPSGGAAGPPPPLTARELEIVALIDAGLSNKEIAARLHIQLTTVKNHVHNILEKLAVRRRTEAVATVRRHRMLPNTDPRIHAPDR